MELSSEQIQQIAQALAGELSSTWLSVFVLLSVFVCGALGAYVGGYLKKRGENYATKQDFNELLSQMRLTTQATTEIKSQIEHTDWNKRELSSLKRQKAEQLIDNIQIVVSYLDRSSKDVFFGHMEDIDHSIAVKCNALATLYFPELRPLALLFCAKSTEMTLVLYEFIGAKHTALSNGTDIRSFREAHTANFHAHRQALLNMSGALEIAIANLLAELSGIPRPYTSSTTAPDQTPWKPSPGMAVPELNP